MSDEKPSDDAPEPRPTPKPGSSAAAAARRARRIGGRPAGAAEGTTAAAAPTSSESATPARPERRAPAPTAATTAADADSTRAVVPGWLTWLPAAVLSAGAVILAVLLIVFSHGVWWGPDASNVPTGKTAALREQVLAAAKTCVAAANSYKYSDLDTYQHKSLACTTGQFTSQLNDTINRVIRVNAPKIKAQQTAQISRGGIESISDDGTQWTILLYGKLSVTNTSYPTGRTDPFGAQVIMEKAHGKWLITKLTTVSQPVA